MCQPNATSPDQGDTAGIKVAAVVSTATRTGGDRDERRYLDSVNTEPASVQISRFNRITSAYQ
jgi:hypothetical protein